MEIREYLKCGVGEYIGNVHYFSFLPSLVLMAQYWEKYLAFLAAVEGFLLNCESMIVELLDMSFVFHFEVF